MELSHGQCDKYLYQRGHFSNSCKLSMLNHFAVITFYITGECENKHTFENKTLLMTLKARLGFSFILPNTFLKKSYLISNCWKGTGFL